MNEPRYEPDKYAAAGILAGENKKIKCVKMVPRSIVVYACLITALSLSNVFFAGVVYWQQITIERIQKEVRVAYQETTAQLQDFMRSGK